MKRTPGPYKVIEHNWEETSIVEQDGRPLCYFNLNDVGDVTEDNQSDLEVIQSERVRMVLNAVNSHAALLEALQACRHRLHCTQCGELTCWECLAADEMAQKALAQAEGGA